jgi:hypothetical protein
MDLVMQAVIVNILMTSFFGAKDIVDIEDIITVLIIEPIVLHAFTRFRKYSARVSRRLVFEARIAYSIRRRQMSCQSLKRLQASQVSNEKKQHVGGRQAYADEATFRIGSAESRLAIYLRLQVRQ